MTTDFKMSESEQKALHDALREWRCLQEDRHPAAFHYSNREYTRMFYRHHEIVEAPIVVLAPIHEVK